jgi:hypothetical protein
MSMNIQVDIDKETIVLSEDMDKATTLVAKTISEILPDLAQLFQQYQVSGVLKAKLKNEVIPPPLFYTMLCRRINGVIICDSSSSPSSPLLEFVHESLSFGEISKQDTEIVEKFWTDIASKLFELETLLSQSIQKMGESFEVQFSIDTATVNVEQSVVCQWESNNILHCS